MSTENSGTVVLPEVFSHLGVQEFIEVPVGNAESALVTDSGESVVAEASVQTTNGHARVTLTGPVRGPHKLRLLDGSGGVVALVPLYGVKLADPEHDLVRTFVDRMDTCNEGPFRTAQGRVLCRRGDEVWVYADDGNIDGHFHAGQLSVTGDEVWTVDGAGLEHRTDLGTQGLRLDGRVDAKLARPWGETRPGYAVRGIEDGLLEVRWNGSQLTSSASTGYSDLVDPPAVAIVSANGRPLLGSSYSVCEARKGCQQTSCPSVFVCAGGSTVLFASFLGFTARDAWGWANEFSPTSAIGTFRRISRDTLNVERVLGLEGMTTGAGVWNTIRGIGTGVQVGEVASMVPALTSTAGRGTVLPDSDAAGAFLWHWPNRGTLLSVNEDWLVEGRATPFELAFHRR